MTFSTRFIENETLADLKSSFDDASDKCRSLLTVFVLFEFYLFFTLINTSDYEFFLATSQVQTPVMNLKFPLVGFFFLVPFLFVGFYFNLLSNLYLHSQILRRWLFANCERKHEEKLTVRLFLPNFWLLYNETSDSQDLHKKGLGFLVIGLVFWLPPIILLFVYWKYAAYQSWGASLVHVLLCMACIIISFWFWIRISTSNIRGCFGYICFCLRERTVSKLLTLLIYILLIAILVPSYILIFGWVLRADSESLIELEKWRSFIPHLEVKNKVIASTTENKSAKQNESKFDIDFSELIARIQTNVPYTKFNACLDDKYDEIDLSGRSFRFIELENIELCNVNFKGADFSYGLISNVKVDGTFSDTVFNKASIADAHFSPSSEFRGATFYKSQLSQVVANRVDFSGAKFTLARVLSSEFMASSFFETQADNSFFSYVNLVGADLRRSRFSDIAFLRSKLYGANLRKLVWFWGSVNIASDDVKYCLIDFKSAGVLFNRFENVHCDFASAQNNIDLGRMDGYVQSSIIASARLKSDSLDLSSLGIKEVPAELLLLKHLKSLDLSHNQLGNEDIQLILLNLPNLVSLNVSHNKISDLEMVLRNTALDNDKNELDSNASNVLKNERASFFSFLLLKLYISHNRLDGDDVERLLSLMPNLIELDVSSNEIENINEIVFEHSSLNNLNLGYNDIGELEFEISKSNIRSLDLSGNRFKCVPLFVRDMKELKVFKIENSALKQLPAWLIDIEQLTRLGVRGNALVNPPQEIASRGLVAIKRWKELYSDLFTDQCEL